jgi:C4-type Zn-finger protein
MIQTKSIKVAASTYEVLKETAEKENTTLQGILDKIVKQYKMKKFFEEVNLAYEKMSSEDWENELAERKEMDITLMDGMEDDSSESW